MIAVECSGIDMYLVYINQNGRVYPQKWEQLFINSETGKPRDENIVWKKLLSDKEAGMTLDELKMVYPLRM